MGAAAFHRSAYGGPGSSLPSTQLALNPMYLLEHVPSYAQRPQGREGGSAIYSRDMMGLPIKIQVWLTTVFVWPRAREGRKTVLQRGGNGWIVPILWIFLESEIQIALLKGKLNVQ